MDNSDQCWALVQKYVLHRRQSYHFEHLGSSCHRKETPASTVREGTFTGALPSRVWSPPDRALTSGSWLQGRRLLFAASPPSSLRYRHQLPAHLSVQGIQDESQKPQLGRWEIFSFFLSFLPSSFLSFFPAF